MGRYFLPRPVPLWPERLFLWSVYLKPGSGSGIKNGFWFNFSGGLCHLANDDPKKSH